jgi:hypothetical protein
VPGPGRSGTCRNGLRRHGTCAATGKCLHRARADATIVTKHQEPRRYQCIADESSQRWLPRSSPAPARHALLEARATPSRISASISRIAAHVLPTLVTGRTWP